MRFLTAVLLLALCGPAWAQDKLPDKLPAPLVLLPEIVAPVPPAPPQSPTAPVKLDSSQLFVVRSAVQCLVIASPEGIVRVSVDGGPLKVRARFVDGDGTYQLKTYAEKNVWCIEAIATGTCELLIIVEGGKEVVRRTIDCNVGPRPPPPDPPGPMPPIPPAPTPDATLLAALQAAYAKDVDTDKAMRVGQLAAVYRQAAKVTALDSTFLTVRQIDDAVRSAAQGLLGVLPIPNTRDAVGVWLRSQLPTKADTALDDQLRQRYVAAWTALSVTLDKVK